MDFVHLLVAQSFFLLEGVTLGDARSHIVIELLIQLLAFCQTVKIFRLCLSQLVLQFGVVKGVFQLGTVHAHHGYQGILALMPCGKKVCHAGILGHHVNHALLALLVGVKLPVEFIVIVGNLAENRFVVVELLVGVTLTQPIDGHVAAALNFLIIRFCHCYRFF